MHSFNIFKIIYRYVKIINTYAKAIVFTTAVVCENKSHFGPELSEIALDVIDLKARGKNA